MTISINDTFRIRDLLTDDQLSEIAKLGYSFGRVHTELYRRFCDTFDRKPNKLETEYMMGFGHLSQFGGKDLEIIQWDNEYDKIVFNIMNEHFDEVYVSPSNEPGCYNFRFFRFNTPLFDEGRYTSTRSLWERYEG